MYDVIIVGSGAGGASCALALVQAGLNCLMLEEGPDIPASSVAISQAESFRQFWRRGAFSGTHFGSPQVSFAEGRCAGGSTTINSGILQSVPEAARRRMECDGVGAFAESFYQDAEAELLAQLPLEYDRNESLNNPTGLLYNVLRRMQHEPVFLPRWTKGCAADNRCSSLCQRGSKPGAKGSFLIPFVSLGGIVKFESRVESFRVMSDHVCVKVKAAASRKELIFRARQLVLAGGSTQTPQLVMRSLVTVSSVLKKYELGIHPTLKINGFMSHVTPDFLGNRLPLVASATAYPNYRVGGGVVNSEVYRYILSSTEDSAALAAERFFSYYVMGHSDSKIEIWYQPSSDTQFGVSRVGPIDRYSIKAGLVRFVDAIQSYGVDQFLISTNAGPLKFDSSQALSRFVIERFDQCTLTTVHIFGSLRRGFFDSRLGLPFLAGADGRVVVSDAGLMTRAPGVNTQLGVLVIGRWVATVLLEKLKNG
jgi:hypothetical protein